MIPRPLALALAGLGLLLTLTVIPAVFTVDEDHYLVTVTSLRDGRLTVPGTDGLTASRELRWFDPAGAYQKVESTPVSSSVPPLYAPLALPFSWLGWRGLVLLNTLAYLAAAWVAALYAKRYHDDRAAPWIAAAAFALGGYAIEYAQGLWPHMLTAALIVTAAYLAARVRDGEGWKLALAAGLAAGLAVGVRYQNVFLAACLGLGVLLWAPRRWRASFAFAGGAALPLAACSLLNQLRHGFWNPISKGPGYIRAPAPSAEGNFLTDTLRMAWARIGDFSTRPPLTGTDHVAYLNPDPTTGAYVVLSAVKKAWLQSAPWLALALVALLVSWAVWRRSEGVEDVRRRELRALSLVVFPTLAMFSASGVLRTDGLSFNQRYFIELVPLAAVALAWALPAGTRLPGRTALAGGAVGLALALLSVLPPPEAATRQLLLLYAPLVLALALLAVRLLPARRGGAAVGLLLGMTVGWALGSHLGDDLVASRRLRNQHRAIAAQLAAALPEKAALFTWWGLKDAAGPLLLDRDLVVLDVRNDDGETAAVLAAELEERGYPSYVVVNGFPPAALARLAGGRSGRAVSREPLLIVELGPSPGSAP